MEQEAGRELYIALTRAADANVDLVNIHEAQLERSELLPDTISHTCSASSTARR